MNKILDNEAFPVEERLEMAKVLLEMKDKEIQQLKMVIDQTKSKSKITFTDYEDAYSAGFEDMVRRVPDISKLANFIGWEPKLGLETIIQDVSKSYH